MCVLCFFLETIKSYCRLPTAMTRIIVQKKSLSTSAISHFRPFARRNHENLGTARHSTHAVTGHPLSLQSWTWIRCCSARPLGSEHFLGAANTWYAAFFSCKTLVLSLPTNASLKREEIVHFLLRERWCCFSQFRFQSVWTLASPCAQWCIMTFRSCLLVQCSAPCSPSSRLVEYSQSSFGSRTRKSFVFGGAAVPRPLDPAPYALARRRRDDLH